MKHLTMFLPLLVVCAFSCKKDEEDPPLFDPDVAPVAEGSWYHPDKDASWQIQLTGTLNTTYDVEVYDIDLYDTSQATINALHKAGSKVICYFSAGSSEDWREDYKNFPQEIIGKAMDGWEGENWLDIRNEKTAPLMEARLDLAVKKKCDGVDPDNVNGYQNDSGFELTASDQLAFNRWIANAAHSRGLAVALKNEGDQILDLIDYFDFSVNEQCHFFKECAIYKEFIKDGKPVFNIEYELTAAEACPQALKNGFRTLVMPDLLDDSSRESCDDQ